MEDSVTAPEPQHEELSRLVQWFEASEDESMEEREQAERDRDYYDGKQLTAAEATELKKKNQPVIVVNRIKRKIDFLRGVEAQQRSDPKAYPRNPQDEDAAHAATDALRFIAESADFDGVASEAWDNLLVEGFCGCEVRVEQRGGQSEIVIDHVPWDRLFRDPYSRRPDCSDARYFGSVLWMDVEEAAMRWPDVAKDLEGAVADTASLSDTYDDRPQSMVWTDGKRRRVRVVQMWHRKDGRWCYATFTKGVLLEGGVSPYLDEAGEPEPGLIVTSAYVDRENRRYGVVREMIGPQDEINKRRSKALHLMSARQTLSEAGAVQDINKAKRELAKPDGHIEVAPGFRFETLPTNDMHAAHFQLLQEAKAEIDMMGPNAAMQGKNPREQSGRAIIAQQQGGYIELGPLSDRLKRWKIRVYRALWNRVRQFWTEERWIRVTDDERNARFVGLNRPVTLRESISEQGRRIGATEEEIAAAISTAVAMGQDVDSVVRMENVAADMEVDIIVDDAPDSVTIQAEQFAELVNLARSGIPIPPDVMIEASQLRNKDKLLEMLRKGPSPEQQEAAALDLEAKRAGVQKTLADANRLNAAATAAMRGPNAANPLDVAEQTASIMQARASAAKTAVEAMQGVAALMQPAPPIGLDQLAGQ